VTNMEYMFSSASVFNQDLSSWNARAVTTASLMFCGCPVQGQLSHYPQFNTTSPPTGSPNFNC